MSKGRSSSIGIDTCASEFARLFRDRPPLRILLESSTESEWVARCLEGLGHEVIAADPNVVAMYRERTRRVKTDRRDAAALALACRTGVYRRTHRTSPATRVGRQQRRIRQQLVRTRTSTVNALRAILRQHGLRVRLGHPRRCSRGWRGSSSMPPSKTRWRRSWRSCAVALEMQRADPWAQTTAAADPTLRQLTTVPGVGPVTALTYAATLDTRA